MPIHAVTIVADGCPLLDNCALDALAGGLCHALALDVPAAVAPLVLVRGTASPVNR